MERLTDKRMKGEGFIPVDHKEYKAILREEKPTAKQIYRRLLEIEDILGDDYDLDRLSVMMNQCMSMRDEVAERFRLTAKIPLDRLNELVEADRDGRCVVLPSGGYCEKDGENALKSAMNTCYYHNNPVTRYIADAVAEKLTREEAEAALKGEKDG